MTFFLQTHPLIAVILVMGPFLLLIAAASARSPFGDW